MIDVKQVNDTYEIRFRYDPAVIDKIKEIPSRRWDATNRCWIISSDKLGFLINQFRGTGYESQITITSTENINVNDTIDTTGKQAIPNIDISKIPLYVKPGYNLYSHQTDFLKWAIYRQLSGNTHGFILADDPGLGKTLSVANLAIYNKKQYGIKHCLIICCINSSKYNWKYDIEEHTSGEYSPYILGSRKKKNGTIRLDTGGKEKLEDLVCGHQYGDLSEPELPYFLIINIEAIRYKVGKQYPIVDELIKLVNSKKLQMIVIDEIHKNASPSSAQGKQLLKLKKKITSSCEWIPMTGTPITKRPTDVFLPLKLIDGHTYSSYYTWCQQFCIFGGYGDHEVVGYKNISYLKYILQNNMIRRLKSEVLDLPPKIRVVEYVENTDYQRKLYEKIRSGMLADRDNILHSLNPLSAFLRLRQVNGSPELVDTDLSITDRYYLAKNSKLMKLLELISDIVSSGEKVVVFSNWVETLRTLYKFVSKDYKVCCFTGTMSVSDREKHKQVFQTNSNYRVLLGTIGALGTSHTLTAATHAIFYDSPWNPSDKLQAEDRLYRIGTKDSVYIHTLVCKDTVDERVEEILSNKQNIASYIVDNNFDIRSNPKLFDFLLGTN